MKDTATPTRPRHRLARRLSVGVLVAITFVAALFGLTYRRQIVSVATHRKGSPTHTEPYVAYGADRPELRVAVAGDVGDSGGRINRTGAAMEELAVSDPFDELLLLGDQVYREGDPAGLQDTVFGPFGNVLSDGAELLAVLGNHDIMDGHGDAQMAALGMPGRWWSVERDDVLFIGLDSNTVDDADQLAWLEDTLRNTTARWRIVALHHSPYSAGYQGSSSEARRKFSPLFERYGVQLVLSGHDHDYQRSVPIHGVTYIVSGGASWTRRTGEESFTAESFSWHHFVELDIYQDRIVGRAINQDLRVADEWVLQP